MLDVALFVTVMILFAMGSGPVKGFAVTLCIGILTSMSAPMGRSDNEGAL